MSNTKFRALLGASAFALTFGAAAAASAQSVTVIQATAPVQIYGGGSTLVQPYVRQGEDCFGTPAPTWDKSTPPVATNEPAFQFTGTPAQDCSTNHADVNVTLQYQGAGSGGGILGLFEHNTHDFSGGGNFTASGAGAFWPTEHYGASDLPLAAADVDVYNNGGTLIPTPNKTTNIAGSNNPSGTIANPLANYGPLVQFPILVAPVTIAYSPIYKEVFNAGTGKITNYRFKLGSQALPVGSSTVTISKLKLSSAVYCEIFNGIITDWADSRIAANNTYTAPGPGITVGGVFFPGGSTVNTIEDPQDPTPAASFSVPIELVGRSDSSGTTGIFTRHLEAECARALPSGETNTIVAGPTLPASRIAGVGTGGPGTGLFTVENGSGALASYMAFVAPTAGSPTSISGKVGYLGPDFVKPYSPTTSGLLPAALANNHDGTFQLPRAQNALTAFGGLAPPESNANGGYVPGGPSAPHRNQPQAWVEPLSATSAIATVGDTVSGAYPITGTSNFISYTCYADASVNSVNNVGVQLNQFLKWYENVGTVNSDTAAAPGILSLRGFAAVPRAWRTAIKETFITPTATGSGGGQATTGLHLWVSSKTSVGTRFNHNPVCNTVPGAG